MNAERRYTTPTNRGLSVQARADGKPSIEGYAAVYYDGDPSTEYELWAYAGERCVERILPGAFARAIREGDDVRALYNHEESCVLGRTAAGTCTLQEDSRGLMYRIDPPDTQIARDVMESIRRGDVTGSSFAFRADDQTWREIRDGDGVLVVREVRSVRLYDVGPVTYPAYGAATTGVRSETLVDEAKQALKEWRLSRKVPAVVTARLARLRADEVA